MTLFNDVPNAIMVVDARGLVLHANRRAERIFGRAELARGGVRLADLMDPEDSFDPSTLVEGAGQGSRRMRFLDQARRAFNAQVTLIRGGASAPGNIFLFFHDSVIGEAIEDALFVLKEDLISVNEALVERNADLERFAAVAAHDLQEPLRKIAIYSDMVRISDAGRLDEIGRRRLDIIHGAAVQMRALIESLLLYSHSSGARLQVDDAPLEELLNDACEALRELILDADATIVSESLPTVRVDRSLIMHVLQNLLSNAIKYRGAEPPRIEITAQVFDDAVLVRVADNGQGFDMKERDRIFQSFTRLHRRDEVKGAGIGLALCKRIVERHGGRIWAESIPGRGSTFFLRLSQGRASRALGAA